MMTAFLPYSCRCMERTRPSCLRWPKRGERIPIFRRFFRSLPEWGGCIHRSRFCSLTGLQVPSGLPRDRPVLLHHVCPECVVMLESNGIGEKSSRLEWDARRNALLQTVHSVQWSQTTGRRLKFPATFAARGGKRHDAIYLAFCCRVRFLPSSIARSNSFHPWPKVPRPFFTVISSG